MTLLLPGERLSSDPKLGNDLLLRAVQAKENSLQALRMILQEGVSPNHSGVVMHCILKDDAKKLQLLLDKGLDPDCSVPSEIINRSTSAYKASKKRKAKKCRRLLRRAKAE